MAIDPRMSEREYTKFSDSVSNPGQVSLKVVNPDGTDIGGGGGGGGDATAANQTTQIGLETTIAGDTTSIDGKITTVNTGAVTISTELPAGTQNIGDVDIASALPAGSNNIGDVDIASELPAGTQNIGDVDIASALPAGSNNIGDVDVASLPATPAGTNDIGYTAMFRRADAIQATITSADASSATAVVAKVAAKNIYVTDIVISVDTEMSVQLQDDAAAVLMEQIYLPATSVWSKTFTTPLLVATNQDLDVLASVAGNISVTVTGYQV